MQRIKHFTFALLVSLGLANSAMATSISSIDLSTAELASAARATFIDSTETKADINLAAINVSYGLQQQGSEFNFLRTEATKAAIRPIKVPEPSAVMLLGLGLLGLTMLRRRKH